MQSFVIEWVEWSALRQCWEPTSVARTLYLEDAWKMLCWYVQRNRTGTVRLSPVFKGNRDPSRGGPRVFETYEIGPRGVVSTTWDNGVPQDSQLQPFEDFEEAVE